MTLTWMRSAIILLFLSSGIFLRGQTVDIAMEDTTVAAVFSYLRSQTDVDFIFNHEELVKIPRVSLQLSDATVEEVLDICLEGTGLTYKRINNTIIVTPRDPRERSAFKRKRAQTLRGVVVDADSRAPLAYATVVVMSPDMQQGVSTGEDGVFRFERLVVGRYLLKVSYVGYQDAVLSEIRLGSASETVITVPMKERTESIDELLINYKKGEAVNQMASVSSRSFSVKEAKRYPVSVSDPARMAQVFAGVTGTDDATNEIVIRGNSPYWLQWRLEGIEVPSPNHFAEEGYNAGAVSILSTNLIGLSDFFTGAFPAEYGNALSGIFDIRLRTGNNERREHSFQAGVLGIDISSEGPFSENYKGSYLFNYRYSTFSLLNLLNINISQNSLPNYQDLSFKFHLPTKKFGTFSFWGLGGLAEDDERFEPDTLVGQLLDNGYNDLTNSGMYAVGLSHIWFPDEHSYFRTIISNSLNYSSEVFSDMDSLGVFNASFEDRLWNSAIRMSTMYNRKFSGKLTLRTGLTFSHLFYNYFSRRYSGLMFAGSFLNSDGSTNQLQSYVQARYTYKDRLIFNGGLHLNYFALSRNSSLEPRVSVQFLLGGHQELSFGYGLHSRNENLPVYFVKIPLEDGSVYLPNRDLKLTKAHHFVLGYKKMLLSDLQFNTETYFQYIYDLPVPNNPDKYWAPIFGGVNMGDTLENIGFGRNYGLEVTLQKFFTPDYYLLFSSSLFDARYKPADGLWHHTKYNINYIFNLVGGKEFEWGEDKMFGVNLRFIWAGGKRYFPIDLPASIQNGVGIIKTDQPFTEQGKPYFRIDLGLKFHIYRESSEHIFSLDIQNLTNRVNVLAQDYNPATRDIMEYPMAPIIPIFNYRLEF